MKKPKPNSAKMLPKIAAPIALRLGELEIGLVELDDDTVVVPFSFGVAAALYPEAPIIPRPEDSTWAPPL